MATSIRNKSINLPEITLRFLREDDLLQVKELCRDWFPIEYPDFWYESITATSFYYALAAFHNDVIVGLLVAQTMSIYNINTVDRKVLTATDLKGGNVGYILTLGVRKEFRLQGIASMLLDQYIEHLRIDYSHKCSSYAKKAHSGKSVDGNTPSKQKTKNIYENISEKYCTESNGDSNSEDLNSESGYDDSSVSIDVEDESLDSREANPLTTDSLFPSVWSSYIVETDIKQSSILERLQCPESDVLASRPVSAVMLHVLTTNEAAIHFYTKKKFNRLSFLPQFYTIENSRRGGYSYVRYINGSFSEPVRPVVHVTHALGLLSHYTESLVVTAKQYLSIGNSYSLSYLLQSVTSVLGRVIGLVHRRDHLLPLN